MEGANYGGGRKGIAARPLAAGQYVCEYLSAPPRFVDQDEIDRLEDEYLDNEQGNVISAVHLCYCLSFQNFALGQIWIRFFDVILLIV